MRDEGTIQAIYVRGICYRGDASISTCDCIAHVK